MNSTQIDPILKSHFLNLYFIALSDLEVDTTELELLYKLGENRGIKKDEINDIIINPDHAKIRIPESLDVKIEYLYDFALMIQADNKIDEFERIALKRFCKIFGFLDENINEITDYILNEVKKGISKGDLINIINKNKGN